MLERLGHFCYRRRRRVLLAWIVVLVGVTLLSKAAGGTYATNFTLPGTETQRTIDLLKATFPAKSGDTAQIVFKAEGGVASVRDRMEAAFAAAKASTPHIVAVSDPYSPPAAGRQIARQGASAGKIAYAEIQLDQRSNTLPTSTAGLIEAAVASAAHPGDGLTIEYGGNLFRRNAPPAGTEAVGLAAAVVILLLAFGSVLAMGLPIVTALFGVGLGLGAVLLMTRLFQVPSFAPILTAMIGIGVGIDYALFIVTRYRQGLHDGLDPESATARAITTAGRAVLFAGTTVVISLTGMFIMGLSFVNGLAVGAAFGVLLTMIASVTLLPALLGFVGRNIDRLRVPGMGRPPAAGGTSFWYRWSRQIQRRPWPFAVGSLVVLVGLALPVLRIHLGTQDAGNDPATLTTRRAYDLLTEGFGPGYNGPFLIAASLSSPADLQTLQALDARLRADPGVATVSPVTPNDRVNPTAATIQVIGKYAPQDVANERLVTHLRHDVIAPTVAGSGVVVHSGGAGAFGIDITRKLSSRLPLFFGAVILLSFLLLMIVFRSILVPLKAAVMNVLAIGAAFGVLVAVFQWGWGSHLIGVGREGPIVSFLPMMLFAILFGLSMDYEVFLLSRIKEEHDRTGDNGLAVADGLESTARVITAAAAIMVTVFMTFVFGAEPTIKLFGLGLAVSILIDATLVRMVLVPATMELLGELNWWLPGWLDRILPNISVEAAGAGRSPSAGSGHPPVSPLDEGVRSPELSGPAGRGAR